MVSCMKTTIELPDELFVEAKKRAAELRRPLRTLVIEGLRSQLAAPRRRASRRRRIRWVTVNGGLAAGLDLKSRERMHEWLRRQR